MKVVDLTLPISDGMPVYPGDPEVRVRVAHTMEAQGWELRELAFGSHTSTHVDAFSHMSPGGENLDEIPLERFMGPAVKCSTDDAFPSGIGLVFDRGDVTDAVVDRIVSSETGFVGIGVEVVFSVEAERRLLKSGVLTFTCLVHVEALPSGEEFTFIGLPLKIAEGDGSPVRAVALVSD